MKKYFDLTWFKSKPENFHFGEQIDWNQTLITKINEARARLSVALKELPETKEKKIVISENCKSIIQTFMYFKLIEWNSIVFTSGTKNLIQVFYDDNYVDITLLN